MDLNVQRSGALSHLLNQISKINVQLNKLRIFFLGGYFLQYELAVDETDLDTLAQQLSRPASCCVLIKGTQR